MSLRGCALLVPLVAAAVVLSGCARSWAPAAEREAQRRVFLAREPSQRINAAASYLSVYPRGAWAEELRELLAVERARRAALAADDEDALRFALSSADDGERELLQLRLAEATRRRLARERREREELAEAAATLVDLRRADAERRAVAARFVDDLVALADGTARAGTRVYRFRVPARRQLVERHGEWRVTVPDSSAPAGAVPERAQRWSLEGDSLFVHLGELLELRALVVRSPIAEAELLGRAVLLIGNALGGRLPSARCRVPAPAPVLLELRCDALHVRVSTGAIDRVELARARTP